ncbi:MAG TPA: electron transfer flavoprotein subunit beta/FixA family protein [Caldilineaceae bacterium]|nr:electron transfer flavoprotein subunit beta/FixA family protein [Caldilineaceae bacterium]
MKIAVLIKQTPDTAELPKISAEEVRSGKVKATMVINPWDEFAVEEAIQLSERYDADAVAISLGTPEAADALKHAIAMGVHEARLIVKGGADGADLWATAAILAAAIRNEGDVDLVLTGKQSVDENSSSVFVGVARKLGYPLLTNVVKVVEIADGQITVERLVEGAQETVTAPLPAVVSVGKEINEPRYPSFMGIRKAGRAQIPTLEAGELGANEPAARTHWTNIRKPEVRKTQVRIIEGASVQEQAAKLADALLAEKVI